MSNSESDNGYKSAKPPTIHQVAALAGVSHQTVSRFLRGNGGLKPDTVEKVTRAIKTLNYQPNLAARSMRTRRSNRIAVILPGSTGFVPTRMLSGAAAAAHEAGYLLDVVGMEGDAAVRAQRMRAILRPDNVDGILSFAPLTKNVDGLNMRDFRIPIVIDGEYDDNMRAQGALADAGLADDIVEYLAQLGHRRFVHVAGSPLWASARNRRRTYEDAIDRLGLTSIAVAEGDWTIKSGWDTAINVIAPSSATAVFAANDMVAFGVIQGLQSRGIDVPGRVSVFGWDDEEIGRYCNPKLSTVSIDRERQGRDAVTRLLDLMHGRQTTTRHHPADLNHLVIRESTGPAPGVNGAQGRSVPPQPPR